MVVAAIRIEEQRVSVTADLAPVLEIVALGEGDVLDQQRASVPAQRVVDGVLLAATPGSSRFDARRRGATFGAATRRV